MIVKPRQVPLTIRKLQALMYRLSATHQSRLEIERDFSRRKAGYKGELDVDYHTNLLPDEDYLIFHALRLPYKATYFQIDTLLLSPQYALLIEIKNLFGELFFDQHSKQVFKIVNGKEEAISDPIAQVKRQKYQLKGLLSSLLPNSFPLEHLVVISNPATILRTNPGGESVFKEVMSANNLIFRISEMETTYKNQLLTTTHLNRVKDYLLQCHQPLNQDVCEQYSIATQDIFKGVRCPNCNDLSMKWEKANWNCRQCTHQSKTAYLGSIHDYILLHNVPFKNAHIREFLQLPSVIFTTRLLNKTNFPSNGHRRHRIYHPSLSD
ncbi:NERD domain-containing protein [Mesobacillus maritimus]|uniref:nuclease-related domain-containing protein n=1 Tax=Mesobacillus maritimus TaxID=1643336 RepID=UPI0020411EAD|nr:nuclease-related domain-containing protein [Mesobacillus maritimus]MCM3669672.1 NERD domain-containing protein [Mesobacillus maritimus]